MEDGWIDELGERTGQLNHLRPDDNILFSFLDVLPLLLRWRGLIRIRLYLPGRQCDGGLWPTNNTFLPLIWNDADHDTLLRCPFDGPKTKAAPRGGGVLAL